MASDYNKLKQDIFGDGGSDLSDVSDQEDEPRAPSPAAGGSQSQAVQSDDEGEGEGDQGADQDYTEPSGSAQKAATAAPKKKRPHGDTAKRSKKASRQQEVQEQDAEPEPELNPQELRRKELDERLDAIIKKPKPKKRKRAGDEEDLGQAGDEEEVFMLRQDMIKALQADLYAIEQGLPALNRLKMLPRVEATLRKSHLELIALDQNILGTLHDWLEPAPDKSLPSLNIQRTVFSILTRMNIETIALKESSIGKVVTFYSKCPRVENSIRRNADNLITVWMRPILRRSAQWRDKQVHRAPRRDPDDYDTQQSQARDRAANSLAPGMQDSATGRRHARIPQSNSTTYVVAPANRIDRSAAGTLGNNKEAMERFKQFNRQLKNSKAASKRL